MQFDEFLSVLDLLQNPDKYKAQIAELTDRNNAIQDSIKTLNVTGDVVKAQMKADALVTQAQKALDDAKAEADRVLAAAQSSYDQRLADLLVREQAADQAIATLRNSKLSWASKAAEHKAKEDAIADAQARLDQLLADNTAKQVELDTRLAKLRDVMG